MRNTIYAEWMKMRKNKIYYVCSLIVFLSAIFIIFKDLFGERPPKDYHVWIMSCAMIVRIFLPIMSGFIITFLIQREYEDKTMINLLSAPTSRTVFLFSKLVIWFFWYVITLFVTAIIYAIGGFLVYPNTFDFEGAATLILIMIKNSLLGFVAYAPLLWVTIMQKRMFYPSVMVTLVFASLEMMVNTMPLQVAVIVPWSAASAVSLFAIPSPYNIIGMISIFAAGIMGILLSCIVFRRQDQ